MKHAPVCFSTGLYLLLFTAMPAWAGVITENLNAFGVTSSTFAGQSFTTGSAAQYFDISFNFYTQNITPAGGPIADANQTYLLLDQEYLGTNAGLGTGTPGFIATTTGVSGNQWVFDPSLTLDGSTQYWLYGSGAPAASQFAVGSGYSGGQFYHSGASGSGNTFSAFPASDLAFTLNGTAKAVVPDPKAFLLDVQYLAPETAVIPPTGPPPFGLNVLPPDVNARFFLGPGTVDPGSSNIVHYGLGDVLSARLPFGDGLWTDLATFQMTAVNGIVDSLTYRFNPIDTPTATGIIILNFPLSITGTHTASGQSISYTYTQSSATLTAVPEPRSFVLAVLGLFSLGMLRRRRC